MWLLAVFISGIGRAPRADQNVRSAGRLGPPVRLPDPSHDANSPDVTERRPDGPDLGQMLGMGGEDVRSRLGAPDAERTVDGETWLIYRGDGWRLRLRLSSSADAAPTVRSWTCEWSPGAPDLASAARSVGVALEGTADSPPESNGGLLRAGVRGERCSASLTATVRSGRVRTVTVFDEAPDWLAGDRT